MTFNGIMAKTDEETRRRVLAAIDHFLQESGRPPTRKEIHETAGLTGHSMLHKHLLILQARGYIRLQRGSRGIIRSDAP